MKMTIRKKLILIAVVGIILPAFAGFLAYTFRPTAKPKEYLTLSEIIAYANKLPESPRADDTDWEDPHFTTYNESRNPGPLGKLMRFLHLLKPKPFELPFLNSLIKEVTAQNSKMGIVDGKNAFIHIKTKGPTKIFVFGDVHAAFHSFLRDIKNLQEKGFIDDNLALTAPDVFLIINGDFINRAPYSIDSLIVLCLLLKKNPERVFYVAGNHERAGHWLDYGLKRELTTRGSSYSTQKVPFLQQFLNFFASLPEAVYISGNKDKHDVIRIAFNGRDGLNYDERILDPSFLQQTEEVKAHQYRKLAEDRRTTMDVRAALKTEDWRRFNRIEHGLGLLDQDQSATSWSVLSSPISVHRTYLEFYDDAFVRIDVDKYVHEASIGLTHQDTRKADGFVDEKPLNIISARDARYHISHSELKIASSMSLIRGQPSIGRQLKSGIDTRVNEFNRNKDEHESNIRLDIDNDDYVPKNARRNTLEHIAAGIKFFLLPAGTPTLLSYMDVVERSDAVVFFPFAGASQFRDPTLKHLVHFRATYEDEVRALVHMLIKEANSSKVMIFYQDDSYGRGPFFAAVEELKKLGVTKVEALPYTRGSISFRDQAQKVLRDPPDALGFFSTSTAAKELIRQIGIGELTYPTLFGLSAIGEVPLRNYLKSKGLQILLGSAVPNPKTSMLPIAKSFREAMQKNHNFIDPFAFEAYVATSIFVEAVASVSNPVPTPQQILSVIERMNNRDFHGLKLNFSKKTRSLATSVWIETGEDVEWKEYKIDNFK